MAIAHEYPNGPDAALVADVGALSAAATRVGDVADLLAPGHSVDPGESTVLLAPVPQAAELVAALSRARGRQASALTGFAGFYRASASSLAVTAGRLGAGEDASAASFTGLSAGDGA